MVKEPPASQPRNLQDASRTRRKSSPATRCPSTSSPRAVSKRPASTAAAAAGRAPTAFPARPARCCCCLAPTGRLAGALLGTGRRRGFAGNRRAGQGRCRKATGISRLSRRIRRSPRSAWCSAAMPSPATARSRAAICASPRLRASIWRTSRRVADGVFLARDLVNTPTNDMGPDALEAGGPRRWPTSTRPKVDVVTATRCWSRTFPMIHAVGRASTEAPRLIDLRWGPKGAPKVTLVGKGVCFDTGGLDIKPASGMLHHEEGHGRRGQRARPRLDDHGGEARRCACAC